MNLILKVSSYGNVMDSINLENLPLEEQTKLLNISNLQKEIQNTQMGLNLVQTNQPSGESNLRREKILSEREKVEMEMKKWQKKVLSYLKQIEKQKPNEIRTNKEKFNYQITMDENEYDSFISLDKSTGQAKSESEKIEKDVNAFNVVNSLCEEHVVFKVDAGRLFIIQ